MSLSRKFGEGPFSFFFFGFLDTSSGQLSTQPQSNENPSENCPKCPQNSWSLNSLISHPSSELYRVKGRRYAEGSSLFSALCCVRSLATRCSIGFSSLPTQNSTEPAKHITERHSQQRLVVGLAVWVWVITVFSFLSKWYKLKNTISIRFQLLDL